MSNHDTSPSTRIKVGIFTAAGILMIGVVSVLVNDRPYWWRPCKLVHVNVEDATGLKTKSPIRSLGIQIGYLENFSLTETHVDLAICITAPVEVLPSTRAYLRGEGFLGDKFVELKPVKYIGEQPSAKTEGGEAPASPENAVSPSPTAWLRGPSGLFASAWLESEAWAEEDARAAPKAGEKREIPVGKSSEDLQTVINRVDTLVNEMTTLTSNLRQAINPEQLRSTMKQLNKTLENASRTLSPEGGLNQTAQRTLAKLEDAIEQLRDMLTRINQGQGSIGKLLNDPQYAEEIRKALDNLNNLLNRANNVRFVLDIGGEEIRGYSSGRGWFQLGIWPNPGRYYLLGIAVDPRGRRTILQTTTTSGGQTSVIGTTEIEQTGILFTAMVGKLFFSRRLDLSIGAKYGDGAISAAVNLGPIDKEDWIQIRADVYDRGNGVPTDGRFNLTVKPFYGVYVMGGIESIYKVSDLTAWDYGAGVSFDDNDIKLLFTLR